MAENTAKTGGEKVTRAARNTKKSVKVAEMENEAPVEVASKHSDSANISSWGVDLMGLLPAPEDLAKYEEVVPGGAERIIEIAERQARHARRVESEELTSAVRTTRIRQLVTFVLAAAAGALGGALLLEGSELAGLIIILVDVVALVGVTIYGRGMDE